MRQIINLVLDGKELELSEPLQINMNYTLEDYTNPTIIKVGYSKTVVVKGTPNNNQIFGDIWNLERVQNLNNGSYSGIYFDPSKRAPMQIYHNGDLIEDGYCKLDEIVKEGKEITYNLTFFASLADFFYSMTYTDDGENMTLADLDYGKNIDFVINRTTITDAWNALRNNTDNKYQIINFAPCYNGKPQGMSADKAIIQYGKRFGVFDSSVSKDGKTYSSYDGYYLADLNKEYTEWETRDLRSYQQRPVLRVKALFEALVRKASQLGFNLKLSDKFFNEENPYYNDAWFTLPMLPTLDNIGGNEHSGILETITSVSNKNNFNEVIPVVSDDVDIHTIEDKYLIPTDSISYGNFNAKYKTKIFFASEDAFKDKVKNVYLSAVYSYLMVTPSNMGEVKYDKNGVAYIDWNGDVTTEITTYTAKKGSGIMVQMVAEDVNGVILGSSPIHILTNKVSDDMMVGWRHTPKVENSYVLHNNYFTSKGSNQYIFNEDIELEIPNIPRHSDVKFVLYVDWVDKEGLDSSKNKCYGLNSSTNKGYIPISEYTYNTTYAGISGQGGKWGYTEFNQVGSGTKITKSKLLQSDFTPCDFMISYTKMFGLYWYKDVYDGVIHLLTRNEFFTGEVVDMTDRIDYSMTSKILPITFKHKFYDLKNEYDESELTDKYQKDYAITYGRQRINTNYNFDSEVNDIYSGNIFKTAIQGEEKRPLFRTFKKDSTIAPNPLYDGMKLHYYYNNTTDESAEKEYAGSALTSYINWNARDGYDCEPRLCLNDDEDGNLEGKNVLLFFNGFKTQRDVNGNSIPYYISDDIDAMFDLNDGQACWYLYGNYSTVQLPSFERYKTKGNTVTHSFDFGTPREIFCYDYSINDESNIYTKYWKTFYNDQLNVNTRVLEAYVLLDRKVLGDMLRKFYIIGNSYYILNKVSDYCITSYNTTKCEFIKVMDLNNYQGQILDYTPKTFNIRYIENNATITGMTNVEEGHNYVGNIALVEGFDNLLLFVGAEDEDGKVSALSERDYRLEETVKGVYNLFIDNIQSNMVISVAGDRLPYLYVDGLVDNESGESVDKAVYTATEGRYYYEISTNAINWYAELPEWVSLNYQGRDELYINIEANDSIYERSGVITFRAGDMTKSVTLTQEGKPREITVDTTQLNTTIDASNNLVSLTYEGRTSGTDLNMTTDADWITLGNVIWAKDNPETGMFNIKVAANPNDTARIGSVLITAPDSTASALITVTQPARIKSLAVSPTSLNFGENGGTKSVNLTFVNKLSTDSVSVTSSNVFVTVGRVIWNGEIGTVSVTMAANDSTVSRFGNLTISSSDGKIRKTVMVTQDAKTEAAFYFDSNGILRCEVSNSDVSEICLLYKRKGDNEWRYAYASSSSSSGSFSASTRYSVGGLHMGDGYAYYSSLTAHNVRYYLSRVKSADWLAKVEKAGGYCNFNWND